MKLPFSKLHGLGNDFIVFDLRHGEAELGSDHAIALCDRHRGIGADGLLLLTGDLSEPHMQVINADGSVPEMCGNGLRCFVKYLVDKFAVGGDAITVVTGAGPLVCGFSRGGDTFEVSVAMGTPTYDPAAVPVAADKPLIDHALDILGTTVHITGVGTGNPHMVLFDTLSDDERLRLGPVLSAHPLFPAQANVEFCTVLPPAKSGAGRLRCDVYERGCGWTQACGTGATAAATAAVRLGKVPGTLPVQVRLPGGWLEIAVSPAGEAIMTGPATHVFDGAWELAS